MSARDRNLSLEEAVETLTSIAELDLDRDAALASKRELILPDENAEVVEWLKQDRVHEVVDIVKETFRVILQHLRSHYDEHYQYLPNQETAENVKSIMLLVGEAAKKIDRYMTLLHHDEIPHITQIREYRKLQEFYLNRVARQVDEGLLSKWIRGLSQRIFATKTEVVPKARKLSTTHLFVDLDSVKNDSEYELFFIRKEDGSRYFSPRLLRNIKLICDFGKSMSDSKLADSLEDLALWKDHEFQSCAKNILANAASPIHQFYHELHFHKGEELVMVLSKCLMALMLGSNPHNLLHDPAVKSSRDYFLDFQRFFHEALQTRQYQHLIAYPGDDSDDKIFINLIEKICRSFFLDLHGIQEFNHFINRLIEEAGKGSEANATNTLWEQLNKNYQQMTKLLRSHATGPLLTVIDLLENDSIKSFEPLLQLNVPSQLFNIEVNDKKILNMRLPSPTRQESINKVFVIEEFKEYLRFLKADEKHLIINFQDRTSWREAARSNALEELQKHHDFNGKLQVITLPKETDFYFQEALYSHENRAEHFLANFKQAFEDPLGGFYFPDEIKQHFTSELFDQLIHQVHQLFFAGRNVLPRERRQDFIEITYLLLELKAIQIAAPTVLSLVCKDGVDISSAANVQLYVFLKWIQGEQLSKREIEAIQTMIYAPALTIRDRLMLPDRFNRMINCIKEIELNIGQNGFAEFQQTFKENFGINARVV